MPLGLKLQRIVPNMASETQSPASSGQFDLKLAEHNASPSADIVLDRNGSDDVSSKPVIAHGARGLPSAAVPLAEESVVAYAPRTAAAAETGERLSESDDATPAGQLFSAVRSVISELLRTPMRKSEVGAALDVSPAQAGIWLRRLHDEGILERQERPVRYRLKSG